MARPRTSPAYRRGYASGQQDMMGILSQILGSTPLAIAITSLNFEALDPMITPILERNRITTLGQLLDYHIRRGLISMVNIGEYRYGLIRDHLLELTQIDLDTLNFE